MSIDARVAIVETKLDQMDQDLKEHELKDEHRMDGITQRLDDLSFQLNSSKSFIGGVVFVISCLWAVITFFGTSIFHFWSTK